MGFAIGLFAIPSILAVLIATGRIWAAGLAGLACLSVGAAVDGKLTERAPMLAACLAALAVFQVYASYRNRQVV